MKYKIPETFFYYVSERLYLTYDGHKVATKDGESIEDCRDEVLDLIKKGKLIRLGEV